jgi:hypothetical protein
MNNINESINKLGLEENINTTLINHSITTIKDLWDLQRKDLKNFSLKDRDINQIIIKMQLNGLDLNHKRY